jgi:hypothetical protein
MPDLFFTGEIKNENFPKFQSFSHQESKKKEGKVAKFLYMVSINSQKESR